MRKKFKVVFLIMVGLLSLIVGYVLVAGVPPGSSPVAAHGSEMPADPHILYLAPENAKRGLVDEALMQKQVSAISRSWAEVRAITQNRPLDALLIDADLFDTVSEFDQTWLQEQFEDGVTIVGLGTDSETLADSLGLAPRRLQNSRGANSPLSETDYLLVSSLILGHPEDVDTLTFGEWIEQLVNRGNQPSPHVQRPMSTSFTKTRGSLSEPQAVDLLFIQIDLAIEGAYQTRSEYQQMLKNFEEQ